MFEQIDKLVENSITLTEEEKDIFHSLLELKKVKKKTLLLKEGEICNFESFILKGCVRSYYVNEDGSETILSFAVEGWWVSDLYSFTEQTPATLFIETLEDCELLTINYEHKAELFNRVPQFERFFRLLVQRSLNVLMHRFHAAVSQTAEQQYLTFLERYPQVAQRVPQHLIAKYIGVSPEFLSKIRGTLYKK
jgi:CRP-like cAMP-binding protein